MKLLDLFSMETTEKFKVTKGLQILGFNQEVDTETGSYILNEISNYVFDTKQSSVGEKVFDMQIDYKYYFYDFLKLGINLNTQDISWWEFDNILSGIMLTENTAIGKVLEYRTWKEPSKGKNAYENEDRKFHTEMRRKYALKTNVDNGLEKMFNYVEKKAGGINE